MEISIISMRVLFSCSDKELQKLREKAMKLGKRHLITQFFDKMILNIMKLYTITVKNITKNSRAHRISFPIYHKL